MNDLLRGAAAGAIATMPMTWTMEVLYRPLPQEEQYPLPPREVSDAVLETAGLEDHLRESQQFWLALVSHFGFGASAGAVYATFSDALPGRPLIKGTAYGLAVWAGSYLGFLPALGLLTPATQHPPRRNALMLAAHVVWGSALGILTEVMKDEDRDHAGTAR